MPKKKAQPAAAPPPVLVPSLQGVHGRVRFVSPSRHLVADVDDGRVSFSDNGGPADCELIADNEEDLRRLVRGEINAVTAALRGQVRAEGDLMLVLKIAGCMRELGGSGAEGRP